MFVFVVFLFQLTYSGKYMYVCWCIS